MKKLFFVFGLILALLFAPVIFGLELIRNAPDLEFSFEVMNGDRPEIIIFDYAGSLQNSVILKSSQLIIQTMDPTEDPVKIPNGDGTINFEGAGNREGVGKSFAVIV